VPALVPRNGQTINADCSTSNPLPNNTNILVAPGLQTTVQMQYPTFCGSWVLRNNSGTLQYQVCDGGCRWVNAGTALNLSEYGYNIPVVAGQAFSSGSPSTNFTLSANLSAGTNVVIGPAVPTPTPSGSPFNPGDAYFLLLGESALQGFTTPDGTQISDFHCDLNGHVWINGKDLGLGTISPVSFGGMFFGCGTGAF
jgi:hypothetical protein